MDRDLQKAALDGATAIAFSFVGMPPLILGLSAYFVVKGVETMQRTLIGSFALLFAAGAIAWAADGAAVYKDHCAKCHGDTGHADTAAGKALKVPPLAGDANVAKMADADVADRIKTNEKHKAFIKSLSDEDVAAVATFVKQLATGK